MFYMFQSRRFGLQLVVLLATILFTSLFPVYALSPDHPDMTGSGTALPSGHPQFGGTPIDSIPHTPLPTVEKVVIAIQNSNSDTLPTMELVPGTIYPLADGSISIRVTDFYSHWMIKGKPVNYSREEKNPAIKVEILKGDSVLYSRWAFKNMPFFGMNKMLGHKDEANNQLYFALLSYEGMKWDDK